MKPILNCSCIISAIMTVIVVILNSLLIGIAIAADVPDRVLYRYMNQSSKDIDRLYTTDYNEGQRSGYSAEGAVGKCFSTQVIGTLPLYRLYSLAATDHLYTTDPNERDSAQRIGYVLEGVVCYVYTDNTINPKACKLYRLWAGHPRSNHFYTTSLKERDGAIAGTADTGGAPAGGGYVYKYEGVAGYLLPYNDDSCPK